MKKFNFLSKTRWLLVPLMLLTFGIGQMWGAATAKVNDYLWREQFTSTTTNTSTTFSASSASAISEAASSSKGTSMLASSDISSLSYTASNVMLTASSGANCSGAHIWLKKNTNGVYFQVVNIPVYNATKVKIIWNQGGSASLTAQYKLDNGSWTDAKNTTSAGANIASNDISITSGTTYIAVKFTRTNADTNIRLDDLRVQVTEVAASSFSVTYNGNGNTGGSVPTDATKYQTGTTVTVKDNTGSLAKSGWTFAGWNKNNTGTGTNYAAGSGTFSISANTTLYAKWTRTVTWSVNGLTNVYPASTITYNPSGSKVGSVPTAPNPASYCGDKFVGWTTDAEYVHETSPLFTTAADSPDLNSITTAVTFYAVFADYAQ